jgi:putative addiction module component (TIGR02574 family)
MAPPATVLPLPDVDDEEEADADHDEAWDAELDRRIADVREGRVECIPVEEVFADIDAMLARVKREQLAAGR